MATQYKDLVDTRIYNQLAGKDLDKILQILADEMDSLQDVLNSLKNVADIEAQTGTWLDLLGKWLGLPRGLSNAQLNELFAFSDVAGSPITGSGFGTLDDVDAGGKFNGLNPVEIGLQPDIEYSPFLVAKAQSNHSDPDVDSIARLVQSVVGNADFTVDDDTLLVTITSTGDPFTTNQRETIRAAAPIAAGIDLQVV